MWAMGCSGCTKNDGSAEGGCESRKAPQRTLLDELIDTVYPTKAWGLPDDEARFGTGVRMSEVQRLSRALSVATRAPTLVRAGRDEDLCNFVYILCVGRTPSLLDVRDELAALEPGAASVRERYLRVALSTVARIATVQEIVMELDLLPTGEAEIRELPRPGVYDKVLLKRMRAVVDLLLASDLTHLDFGLLDKPVLGADESRYLERYAETPRIVNYLFYAQPPSTASVTFLPATEGLPPPRQASRPLM